MFSCNALKFLHFSHIQFWDSVEGDFVISLGLIDKVRNCGRKLPVNDLLFSGDLISKQSRENNFRIYNIQIRFVSNFLQSISLFSFLVSSQEAQMMDVLSKIIFVIVTTSSCRRQYVKFIFERNFVYVMIIITVSTYGPEYRPFFAYGLENSTLLYPQNKSVDNMVLFDLLLGLTEPSCPVPCISTIVTSSLRFKSLQQSIHH